MNITQISNHVSVIEIEGQYKVVVDGLVLYTTLNKSFAFQQAELFKKVYELGQNSIEIK